MTDQEQTHTEWLRERLHGYVYAPPLFTGPMVEMNDRLRSALITAVIACRSIADQHAEDLKPHVCSCLSCETWREFDKVVSDD